jgi:hypothetical protein
MHKYILTSTPSWTLKWKLCVKGTYNAPSSAICVVFFLHKTPCMLRRRVLSSPRETTARARAPKTKSPARGALYEFLQAIDGIARS